jgi:hypothetical protein
MMLGTTYFPSSAPVSLLKPSNDRRIISNSVFSFVPVNGYKNSGLVYQTAKRVTEVAHNTISKMSDLGPILEQRNTHYFVFVWL